MENIESTIKRLILMTHLDRNVVDRHRQNERALRKTSRRVNYVDKQKRGRFERFGVSKLVGRHQKAYVNIQQRLHDAGKAAQVQGERSTRGQFLQHKHETQRTGSSQVHTGRRQVNK